MKRTTCSDRANSRSRSAPAGGAPEGTAKKSAGTLEVNNREARSAMTAPSCTTSWRRRTALEATQTRTVIARTQKKLSSPNRWDTESRRRSSAGSLCSIGRATATAVSEPWVLPSFPECVKRERAYTGILRVHCDLPFPPGFSTSAVLLCELARNTPLVYAQNVLLLLLRTTIAYKKWSKVASPENSGPETL